MITCEGEIASLDCGSNFIDILGAWYGRTNEETCDRGGNVDNTNCNAGVSTKVVMYECQGQHSCTLHAKNSAFGDPCVGIQKYLEVSSKLTFLTAFFGSFEA